MMFHAAKSTCRLYQRRLRISWTVRQDTPNHVYFPPFEKGLIRHDCSKFYNPFYLSSKGPSRQSQQNWYLQTPSQTTNFASWSPGHVHLYWHQCIETMPWPNHHISSSMLSWRFLACQQPISLPWNVWSNVTTCDNMTRPYYNSTKDLMYLPTSLSTSIKDTSSSTRVLSRWNDHGPWCNHQTALIYWVCIYFLEHICYYIFPWTSKFLFISHQLLLAGLWKSNGNQRIQHTGGFDPASPTNLQVSWFVVSYFGGRFSNSLLETWFISNGAKPFPDWWA